MSSSIHVYPNLDLFSTWLKPMNGKSYSVRWLYDMIYALINDMYSNQIVTKLHKLQRHLFSVQWRSKPKTGSPTLGYSHAQIFFRELWKKSLHSNKVTRYDYYNDLRILQSKYDMCGWPGDAKNQTIGNYDHGQVWTKYSVACVGRYSRLMHLIIYVASACMISWTFP